MDTPSEDLTGQTFGGNGRLTVRAKVNEGAMGIVYEGWDSKRSRRIAMKFLRPEFLRSRRMVKRFRREGEVLRDVRHRNIVQTYGLGQDRRRLYIVSEFISGSDLGRIIREKAPLDVTESLRICKGTALALATAHKLGIIHRDLKPENIMIRESDRCVKVLDFGVAKYLYLSTLTRKEDQPGTVGYMAPEQTKGHNVDHRADIFALGAILYEMLTGRYAFEGRTTKEIQKATRRKRPIDPTRFNSEVTKPVIQLVDNMIKKSRRRRPSEMQQVIEAVDVIKTRATRGYTEEDSKVLSHALEDSIPDID